MLQHYKKYQNNQELNSFTEWVRYIAIYFNLPSDYDICYGLPINLQYIYKRVSSLVCKLQYSKLKRQRPSLLILNIMTQLNQTNKEVESHPLPISDEVDWQGCRLMCWSLVESYSALQLSSFSDLHHGHHIQLEVTLPQQIHKYNYLEVELAIRSTNTIKHHKKIIRSDCLTDLCIVIWISVFIFPNPSYREIQYSDVLPPLQSWE